MPFDCPSWPGEESRPPVATHCRPRWPDNLGHDDVKQTLPRRHAQRPVEPDRLAVQEAVRHDMLDQRGVFVGRTQALREGNAFAQAALHVRRSPSTIGV